MENWTTENGQTTHEVKTLLNYGKNHWKIDNGKWTNGI